MDEQFPDSLFAFQGKSSGSAIADRTRCGGIGIHAALREQCPRRHEGSNPFISTMLALAQLARASDCGSEGRRFKSGTPTHFLSKG